MIPIEVDTQTLLCVVRDEQESRWLWEQGQYGRAIMDDYRMMRRHEQKAHERMLEREQGNSDQEQHNTDEATRHRAALVQRVLSVYEVLYLVRRREAVAVEVCRGQVNSPTSCSPELNHVQVQYASVSPDRLLVHAALRLGGGARVCRRLAVFCLLRDRGWVVRDGVKFGADFVLYKTGGPVAYHAEYTVTVNVGVHVDVDDGDGNGDEVGVKTQWKHTLAQVRFTEQSKKRVVLTDVGEDDEVYFTEVTRWIP